MIIIYFSGTGNSKYIAELFGLHMNAKCHSIEESVDFNKLIEAEEVVGFCYPIYGSRVPRIMREFVGRHMSALKDKKLIIFCTQMLFSGDGARVFTDMFPRDYIKVIYAEHFLMPNNVGNLLFLPVADDREVKRYMMRAKYKMRSVCRDIKSGIIKKRGFNIVSRTLGLPQGVFMPAFERMTRGSVRINSDCTRCGVCVDICPTDNLSFESGKIVHEHKCIACYRCVNKCPEKAITTVFHGKVRKQYKGI